MAKTITAVRLTEDQREALRQLGEGSISRAVREAIALLVEKRYRNGEMPPPVTLTRQ